MKNYVLGSLLMLALWAAPAFGQVTGDGFTVPVDRSGVDIRSVSAETITPQQAFIEIRKRLALGDRPVLNRYLIGPYLADANLALIQQVGDRSRTEIEQRGEGNVAVLYELGDRNRSSVLQRGDDNIYALWLRGDQNRMNGRQIGDRNIFLFEGAGENLTFPFVSQVGNDLKAVQIGSTVLPFGIEQRGNGMEVIIEHRPGY